MGVMYVGLTEVHAQDGSSWLGNQAPVLGKIVDLQTGATPDTSNTNCSQQMFWLKDQPTSRCVFDSPIGRLTTQGELQTGPNSLAVLHGHDFRSLFLYSPLPSIALISIPATTIGENLGIYHQLTKSQLQPNLTDGLETYYTVSTEPDTMLRDPTTGQLLQVNTDKPAFSSNGQWMVTNMPHQGLLRVHLPDLAVQLFAAPIEQDWYLGLASPSLAISDDGRFVAANVDIFSQSNLTIYDLSTCNDQLDVPLAQRAYCSGKNIWKGQTLHGQAMGQGLLDLQPDLQYPTHLRFINDDSISFSARYGLDSPIRAANFIATAPGVTQHKLGLLGMGDSYISGQGEFDYRVGTDTDNNPCHLSDLSYPFSLGRQYFNSYNSIACSGARTDNVIGDDDSYQGQVHDKVKEKKRLKPPILSNFLPGYIYQQEFASAYQPEAILLSVGGDDIGFADIVKQCVANSGGGTCYDTYEDRAELVNEINATYTKLVDTYTTLREQSGGARLYVVGYPQVAKVGGDCGLNVHLNAGEVAFAAQLISYLDTVVERAAATAGVFYVDTQQAFDGHRLCEGGQSAMNGFTVGGDAGTAILGHTVNFIGAESYHPTVLGHQLLAHAIAVKTNGLSAPMPAPGVFAPPQLDANIPLLQEAPKTGRSTRSTRHDDSMSVDVTARGQTEQVAVNGAQAQLKPGGQYSVVLHSDPITIGSGTVDADGNISMSVTVPLNAPPGYHTLHVYATDMAGDAIDIQKAIYVAASANEPSDAGGDACLLFPASGQDADRDGIDDACDGDITTASNTPPTVGQKPVVTSQQPMIAAQTAPDTTAPQTTRLTAIPSAVLGASVGSEALSAAVPAPDQIFIASANAQLFRLNWRIVLEAGALFVTAITTAYSLRQK
ncbi:MAG TPA: SGNH/GDSL hydrolase family protein [Candidatus Saccharimonadales bacterium]|nr:SGNH/GDSL hydrolase family protein [Candidatus Saccharimonadales bacterium]